MHRLRSKMERSSPSSIANVVTRREIGGGIRRDPAQRLVETRGLGVIRGAIADEYVHRSTFIAEDNRERRNT